ncbi:MAG: (Fe-S)-binding protein [Lentisphaeria bacterium]
MNIDQFNDTINACRFCFMCRHLSPVGNVTFRESDTPRGRALLANKLQQNLKDLHPDFIDAFFRAELSAANRFHCVSHYDENGLILAARRDIVEAGLAPENVKKLAAELQNVDFKIEGSGNTLYYVDLYNNKADAPKECKVISGGDTGKALEVLGFVKESAAVMGKFKKAVEASGCKTLVTSCPASYDMLKKRLDGVKVLHSSEFVEGKRGSGTVYYLDSDYLKNYNDNMHAPRELLKKLGYTLKQFGTNNEESYSAGEGAVIYDKLNPELVARLCAHIVELSDNFANDVLVTASPYTRSVLNKYAPQLKVLLLDQIASKGI